MGIALLIFLYVAWFLSWGGTVAASCTMADAKSLGGGMLFSCIYYLGSILSLPRYPLGRVGVILSLPLCILLTWQALWGVKLFVAVNLGGLSACNVMMGDGYGPARGGWIELVYAPYYFLVSAGSLGAVLLSYRLHLKSRLGNAGS